MYLSTINLIKYIATTLPTTEAIWLLQKLLGDLGETQDGEMSKCKFLSTFSQIPRHLMNKNLHLTLPFS
jgi:hypothetical protein